MKLIRSRSRPLMAVLALMVGLLALMGHAAGKQHTSTKRTIAFTLLINDYAMCHIIDNRIPMCSTPDFVCRQLPGQEMAARPPSCLSEKLPSRMGNYEQDYAKPWHKCDVDNEERCAKHFECVRVPTTEGPQGQCLPPDAVYDDERHAGACTSCTQDQYCQWQYPDAKQQLCAKKPYH